MKKSGFLTEKLKNGHFWAGIVSVAFILSAIVIFIIDQVNDKISFPYVISSMLCIYAAALSIFLDILSLRLRDNRNNVFVGIICIALEIVITAFTVVIVRQYAVLQNDLNIAYEQWEALNAITDDSLAIYNKYLELSRGMEKFYLQMGTLFMLWWVPAFIMTFIKAKKVEDPEESEKAIDGESEESDSSFEE